MNKNLRPYVISVDWLSLHLHRRMDFNSISPEITYLFATDEQKQRYTFEDIGHGSHNYNTILKVQKDGDDFAELSLNPRQKEVNRLSCTIRIVNKQLYTPDIMLSIADFITLYGFRFVGISRIDIAYDCNLLYGSLKPEHLIKKYLDGSIIKYGSASGYIQFRQNYSISGNKAGGIDLSQDITPDPKIDNQTNPINSTKNSSQQEPVTIHTITWGAKASAVQVQLYNKSLEMKSVKYKHHIAERWRLAGLDKSSDIWRIEIRITSAGKLLENTQTGNTHILNMTDILFSEQLEIIFQSYANKYFKFFTLPKEFAKDKSLQRKRKYDLLLKHKSRLTQYRVLSLPIRDKDMALLSGEQTKYIPRTQTREGDYSRTIRSTMNVLESMIVSQAKAAAPDIESTITTYNNLKQAYRIERKKTLNLKEAKAQSFIEHEYNDIHNYFMREWPDVQEKWFCDTAKRASMLAWSKIIAGANKYCYNYLFSLGYNVVPSHAEEALNHLLDDGCIPEELIIKQEELWKDEYLHPYLSQRQ